jgi:hypothetical protein
MTTGDALVLIAGEEYFVRQRPDWGDDGFWYGFKRLGQRPSRQPVAQGRDYETCVEMLRRRHGMAPVDGVQLLGGTR